VLIVDDEPAGLQLVRRLLQADGHEVHEALDGEQAIALFEKVKPDLVLLDVVIPKMDGLEVLREIRLRDKFAGVIMVSALSSEQLAVRSMLSGADDYVSKPFKLRAIRLNIRQVMDKVNLRRRNAQLQQELRLANEKLRKYMDKQLVDTLLKDEMLPTLGGQRCPVSVLFLDFSNFTPLAFSLPPDEVLQVLNDYFSILTQIVTDNDGFIDKILGDGFMALYNTPVSLENHATYAVISAIDMRRRVKEWNRGHRHPLSVKIGIHTGDAVVGNIGTPDLMNYTAIGDAVNLAKRLEENSEADQILISTETNELLDREHPQLRQVMIKSLGLRTIKGRAESIELFEVLDCEEGNSAG
jgi:class 3 adenylate cyclase